MPSFSLMGIFPKPDHQRSQPCHNISLHTQCCRGFPHSVLMTLHLMHSPIWIRILVRMPIDILDTPLRPGKMLLKYWSLFPSPWQGPRVCLRSVSTSGTTPKCSCSTSFFSSSSSSLWYGQAVVLIYYILTAFCPVGNIVAKWVFQRARLVFTRNSSPPTSPHFYRIAEVWTLMLCENLV